LDLGIATFAVERLSTIGLNIFGMQKALKNTVGKASVAQVVEAWKLSEC